MGTGPHSGANLLGWTEPEAVVFGREAERCGVPSGEILVDDATGEVTGLEMRSGEVVTADYYVSAMPVDILKRFVPMQWQTQPYL